MLDGTLGFPDNCINYEECWIEPLVSQTIVLTINPVGEEEECWIEPRVSQTIVSTINPVGEGS